MPVRRNFGYLLLVTLLGLVGVGTADAHYPLRRVADAAPAVAESRSATGVVHAFVVDNLLRGTSHRYVELREDDGNGVPLDGDIANRLPVGARVKAAGTRHGKVMTVDSASIVTPASNGQTKAAADVEGTLEVLHADDFQHGKSSFVYELREATGKSRTVRLASLPAELAPGMRLRVTGRFAIGDADAIIPDRITVLAEPTSTAPSAKMLGKAATANDVLVILANFSNTAMPSYTPAQAQQVMTTNTNSVSNFFREVSYGQQLMNVSVTPSWVTMSIAQPVSCGSSDWMTIGSAAEAAAKQLGTAYDPANFDFVVYLFPTVPACGWIGLGYIGYPHKAWINGTKYFGTSAIAHEMGHNFGLLHAASLRCSGSIGGTCSASEYGDPFDTMGNQSAMHYNAAQKAILGWIGASSVLTHSGGTATYTLAPIEAAGGTSYAVTIPTASPNRTYWLEFRQPIGFDSGLSSVPNNGAQIRVGSPFETLCSGCDNWSDDTELLDMTPATATFSDATLVAGQAFSDATYGISVAVLSATSSALTVRVSTGGAGPGSTSTSLASSMNPALAGTTITFTATVSGNAPIGNVTFSVGACGAVPLSGSGNTRSASCAVSGLAAGSYSVMASYGGDAMNLPSSNTLVQTMQAASVASLPVYRFNTGTSHFYTASESEKNVVLSTYPLWTYEGIAFYVDASPTAQDLPVYRFNTGIEHFYTISEAEKNYVLANMPTYQLEGIAFYASPTSLAPLLPVYRFNAGTYHFYTISENEKNYVLANFPMFALEGVAFYAKASP